MKEIELKKLRKKREKHFLQENGEIVAKVYNDNIHYYENGNYVEIDNTLIKENDYYKNKSNSYKTYFKDKGSDELMKLISQDCYLNVMLKGSNLVVPIINKTSIKYVNLLDDIDFEYQLLSTKVKENITVNTLEAANNDITYLIKTNLDLELKDNIIMASRTGETKFIMQKPYMMDADGNRCGDVFYYLSQVDDNTYELKLILDYEWISHAKFPIIIDPTISTGVEQGVYDTYIYSGDTNVDRNSQDILKVGVEKVDDKEVINRALIKFDLPTIGTGSQVIEATLNLIGYGIYLDSQDTEIINIHEVTENWKEETATWTSLNSKYNQRIEASFNSYHSILKPVLNDKGYIEKYTLEPRINEADITSLVKRWYSDKENNGILLKANKEIYKNTEVSSFYSKNNSIAGDSPKPVLLIRYRNQNGIEDYMDYQTQNFSNGSTYLNTFNGNLVALFNVGNTLGGKYSANLNLVYNSNDIILETGMNPLLGFLFNYDQTINKETISEVEYLNYRDSDGTNHYFYTSNSAGKDDVTVYYDEDGLNMTIEEDNNNFILTDNNNTTMKFEKIKDIGYLSEITDANQHTIQISRESTYHRITHIIDGTSSEITISYGTNKIEILCPTDNIILNVIGNQIGSIVSKTGTTSFTYNEQGLIETITDMSGKKMKYEYYDQKPYRVKQISEYGLNNTLGQFFTVEYGFKVTTLSDNKGNTMVMTYNNLGNLVGKSYQKKRDDLRNSYGISQEYGYDSEIQYEGFNFYKNKLLSSSVPLKYVKNYLNNSSFEEEDHGFQNNFTENQLRLSRSIEYPHSGLYCLKGVCTNFTGAYCTKNVSIPKGNLYTLSAYVCGYGHLGLTARYTTLEGMQENRIEALLDEEEFTRIELSFFYPEEAIDDLAIDINFISEGTFYIDDMQLEEGDFANKYNMLENSDFLNGLVGWDVSATELETGEIISNDKVFSVVDINENGDKALKIQMNPSWQSSVSKTYMINGKQGEVYNVSFWYKHEGFYASGEIGNPIRNNVTISYQYIDTEAEDGRCTIVAPPFNPNETDWQFYSTSFLAEKDFSSLTLLFDQSSNANDFYITNLYLFKDVRENRFSYDKNGNLISHTLLNQSDVKCEYDENSRLVKLTQPNGDSITAEFDNDNANIILSQVSSNGIANKYTYDEFENNLLTQVKQIGTTIENNNQYQIRSRGTDQYIRLIANGITMGKDLCGHDKWIVESVNENYYRLKHAILNNKYMKKSNDSLLLLDGVEDSLQVKFISNSNGSYLIKVKNNDEDIQEIPYSDVEALFDQLTQGDYSVADFFDEAVTVGLVSSQELMDRHVEQAIENGVIYEDMLATLLSELVKYNDLGKITVVSIVYNAANDEENPIYVKRDENNIVLAELEEDNPDFEFYFESAESKYFIETSASYTADGKFLLSRTDDSLHTTYYDIDIETGLLNSITDAKGNVVYNTYDEKDRIKSVVCGSLRVDYSYDEYNRMNKITQGNKNYNIIYDEFGNVHQVLIGNNIALVTNDFFANNGDLHTVTYGNGQSINFNQDEFGRITSIEKSDDSYQFKYDSNGDLVRIVSDRETLVYNYDLARRISDFIRGVFKVKYVYDQNNNVTEKRYLLNQVKHVITNTFNIDDMITQTNLDGNIIEYTYDDLGRLVNKKIGDTFNTQYEYESLGYRTSLRIKNLKNENDKFSYCYDKFGNITHIYHNGNLENEYYYDAYNELIGEINYVVNKKYEYVYDYSGNIVTKKVFNVEGTSLLEEIVYQYDNADWEDQLTKYNNEDILYDGIGNPVKIGKKTLTWINGRQLQDYNGITFEYDVDGFRTKKVVNDTSILYYTEGKRIIFEKRGQDILYFIRNSVDDLIGFKYNDATYYYLKNSNSDIIGILDSDYNILANYTYDAWGNILAITNSNGIDISQEPNHIANINPFRYRSYYYDCETNLYYLNHRYYNPAWGRFLNADGTICANEDILSYNLYAYCSNNPIANIDTEGINILNKITKSVGNSISSAISSVGKAYSRAKKAVSNTFNSIKNSFVLDIGYGVGLSAKTSNVVGVSTGGYADKSIRIKNGKVQTGVAYKTGSSFSTFSVVKATSELNMFHEDHEVSGPNIENNIEHMWMLPNPFAIASCKHLERSYEAGLYISKEFYGYFDPSYSLIEDNKSFIGIDFDAHTGFGGHFKIGFEI